MKILLVEDEKKVVSFIRQGMKSEGHLVDAAGDGEEGLAMAESGDYDLVILDVMLPKMDGVALCKKLRARGKTLPIIMLTARDEVEDRVRGLDAGADDYLAKPFSFAELLARVRALGRRRAEVKEEALRFEDLTLDPGRHEVRRGGKEINLSATEFKILAFLMRHPDRVISKIKLLENVWGYDFDPESNVVEVFIKYLRDKIDRGGRKDLIQTVRGVGYKLCA